jgi:DnaJ-class molecular chaperone
MVWLVLLGAVVIVGYVLSVRFHPLKKCSTCKGSGRLFGRFYKGSYRRCSKCQGRGQVDRMGTKVFFGGTKNTGTFKKN